MVIHRSAGHERPVLPRSARCEYLGSAHAWGAQARCAVLAGRPGARRDGWSSWRWPLIQFLEELDDRGRDLGRPAARKMVADLI